MQETKLNGQNQWIDRIADKMNVPDPKGLRESWAAEETAPPHDRTSTRHTHNSHDKKHPTKMPVRFWA